MSDDEVRSGFEPSYEPTMELRWYRPPHGTDNDKVLQQRFRNQYGEPLWVDVPTELAD